jgi:hypothetical protein
MPVAAARRGRAAPIGSVSPHRLRVGFNGCTKTTLYLFLPGQGLHTIEPQFIRMLGNVGAKQMTGLGMRGFQHWSFEATELGHTIARHAAPDEVLAEREAAWTAELTPNMVVLGDPLPGRSALDARRRKSPH